MAGERKKIAAKFNYAKDWEEEVWRPVLLGTLRNTAKERVTLLSFEEFASSFKDCNLEIDTLIREQIERLSNSDKL